MVQFEKVCREVLTANQIHTRILNVLVVRPVVGQHRVIDGFSGQFGVQFARLSVQTRPSVIVDAIGNVGSLLNLCEIAASTYGVDAS